MPTLKSLKKEIDAGATVQDNSGDGFTSVEKVGRKYYWTYANYEYELYDTWGELYQNAEPDAEAFTEKELDTWSILVPAYVGKRVTFPISDDEYDAIQKLKKQWDLKTTAQVIRRSLLTAC